MYFSRCCLAALVIGLFACGSVSAQSSDFADISGDDVVFELLPGSSITVFTGGESEQFDASGLVTFRFIPSALTTGAFTAAELTLIGDAGLASIEAADAAEDALFEPLFFSIESGIFATELPVDPAGTLTIEFSDKVFGTGFIPIDLPLAATLTGVFDTDFADGESVVFNLSLLEVPEPATGVLLFGGVGLASLGLRRRA